MNNAPDHIFIACPKCRKPLTVALDHLALHFFKCPNCDYTVTTDPDTLKVIKEAHDNFFSDSVR